VAEPARHHRPSATHRRSGLIWLPGLAVACGAAVATAHGLYEVALAARVPVAIAWLYPLITDGLALVAYAATARLSGSSARYAWAVVVIAAGLSGLAQASWLAADGLASAPALRFGVGAWPAIAAAIVAHLLHLLLDTPRLTGRTQTAPSMAIDVTETPPVEALSKAQSEEASRSPSKDPSSSSSNVAAEPDLDGRPDRPSKSTPRRTRPVSPARAGRRPPRRQPSGPPGAMRARAAAMAETYLSEHGTLPTVRTLMATAEVSRGTAAAALHDVRQ
jgi:hypothetical protein